MLIFIRPSVDVRRLVRLLKAIVAAIAIATCSSATADNLVTNGSFESPFINDLHVMIPAVDGVSISGWVVDDPGTSVDQAQAIWYDAEGWQSIDMNGVIAGTLYQDLATVAGQKYKVRFALAGNPFGSDDKRLEVLWDGVQSADLTFDQDPGLNPYFMSFGYHEFIAVATGASTRLTFHSLTGAMNGSDGFQSWYGPVIDDVSVETIPEPSATLLAILGVFLAAARRRR